jgi:hypothetical protein
MSSSRQQHLAEMLMLDSILADTPHWGARAKRESEHTHEGEHGRVKSHDQKRPHLQLSHGRSFGG